MEKKSQCETVGDIGGLEDQGGRGGGEGGDGRGGGVGRRRGRLGLGVGGGGGGGEWKRGVGKLGEGRWVDGWREGGMY